MIRNRKNAGNGFFFAENLILPEYIVIYGSRNTNLAGRVKMLCQICKKNPATIHVQEIVNGEKHLMHFCQECAEKKAGLQPFIENLDLGKIIKEMFEGSAADGKEEGSGEEGSGDKLVCGNCGWTMEQLRKTGRFGCPECLRIFFPLIKDELSEMQHKLRHEGRVPPGAAPLRNRKKKSSSAPDPDEAKRIALAGLKKDLAESVRREEYELAAELRDRIAALEKEMRREDGLPS